MKHRLSRGSVTLLSCALLGWAGDIGRAAQPRVEAGSSREPQANRNSQAETLREFNKRIDAYMQLHDRAKGAAPPLKQTKDAAEIHASQEAMTRNMQQARAGAKQGDIFSPEIRQLFRSLMYPEVQGREGAETKAALTEERDELKGVSLKVNAKYPDDAPLATVPPNILAALPKLPEALEYRFVDRHLILYDNRADIIVDFVPNAIR